MHQSYQIFLQHAPQPSGLYPNWAPLIATPMARGRGEGAPPQMAEDPLFLCLKHYIFLKLQAYRMQEKCSPEGHDCKISPRGTCPPPVLDPLPRSWAPLIDIGTSVLASWHLQRSTFWQIQPPPIQKAGHQPAYCHVISLHMQWDGRLLT